MSAATRRHAAGALLAVLLPLTQPVAAPPPAASSVAVPAGVSVEVASGGKAPAYRIEVRNETDAAVTTQVRLGLPPDAVISSVSEGGQAGPTVPAGTEVAWQLRLPARGAATLRASLDSAPHKPLAAPACAFVEDGIMAYDCATAIWGLGSGTTTPWWRQPAVIVGAVALLAIFVAAGWWWVRRRRRRGRPAGSRPVHAAAGLRAAIGPVKPVKPAADPAEAAEARRRRRPPTWQVVGSAAVLLVGTLTGLVWVGGSQAMSLAPNTESTSGAWVGTASTGRIGMPIRDSAFEFTVYRMACAPDGQPGRQQCVANIGLHNVANASQPWYASMQRAYLPDGTWVTADEAATRAANGNQDIFAYPIPAGGRLLAPLVFTVSEGITPTRIELRSAVFSAGVSIAF